VRIGIAVALCALVLPAAALAKGPTAATITGPGLAQPLELGGGPHALRTGEPMEVLMNHGGFFQVAWGGEPGRTLAQAPTTSLGPRYRVVYLVPGPYGKDDRIRQDLYPFAKGGPLSYMPAGQPFFDTRRTIGGWFRGRTKLTTTLLRAGLPAQAARTPPAAAAAEDDSSPPVGLLALVATLGLAGLAAVAFRRRARPASA
jgi:hypothetical protein